MSFSRRGAFVSHDNAYCWIARYGIAIENESVEFDEASGVLDRQRAVRLGLE